MEATGAEKGMFSEEEQFYAYTEQSEESEVSTAGKVMWKTNIISVRKKTSDIHLPFVRKQLFRGVKTKRARCIKADASCSFCVYQKCQYVQK